MDTVYIMPQEWKTRPLICMSIWLFCYKCGALNAVVPDTKEPSYDMTRVRVIQITPGLAYWDHREADEIIFSYSYV